MLCFVVLNVAATKATEGNQYYGLAIAFAFLCMVFDEIYKIRFRAILQKRKEEETKAVAQKATDHRIEIVVDLLEKYVKAQGDTATDMREIKVQVGELEKSLRESGGAKASPLAGSTSHVL